MTTIDARRIQGPPAPYHETYVHAPHYRSNAEEFDAVKIGMWLFLATEVLLFSGLFCAYAVFRMMYPQAWSNGSEYLDPMWGGINTVVLLVSSFFVAWAVRNAQRGEQGLLRLNLFLTIVCAIVFVLIKVFFEYIPKWSGWFLSFDPALSHHSDSGITALGGLFRFVEGYGGKRPAGWFTYPFATDPHEPMWWSVYYSATAIHATHVIIGACVLGWVLWRAFKNHFGPRHYTAVEVSALYWHIVDLIWIFLFPLLYLIH